MRIASTTVVTSFEQESMMTLSVRSTCINCRSVSRPSISGISTSRMMKSGRSPVADALERFLAAGHRFDIEAVHFQQRLEILANARFVVHYQNFFFVSHLFS